jgi:hypothetical protein
VRKDLAVKVLTAGFGENFDPSHADTVVLRGKGIGVPGLFYRDRG